MRKVMTFSVRFFVSCFAGTMDVTEEIAAPPAIYDRFVAPSASMIPFQPWNS